MSERTLRFEQQVLPHLDAAYNLARWLTRNDHDAQDVVQEAVLRAYRFFDGLRGAPRPWLLAIVRNASFTWLERNRAADMVAIEEDSAVADSSYEPETVAASKLDRRVLNEAIAALPVQFREVLVLRELEDMSYKDIARIAEIPIGTVMSRLARARRLLADSLKVISSAARQQVLK
jgi:RNA polymerase sigma-70 factor (ECF subfamily)